MERLCRQSNIALKFIKSKYHGEKFIKMITKKLFIENLTWNINIVISFTWHKLRNRENIVKDFMETVNLWNNDWNTMTGIVDEISYFMISNKVCEMRSSYESVHPLAQNRIKKSRNKLKVSRTSDNKTDVEDFRLPSYIKSDSCQWSNVGLFFTVCTPPIDVTPAPPPVRIASRVL